MTEAGPDRGIVDLSMPRMPIERRLAVWSLPIVLGACSSAKDQSLASSAPPPAATPDGDDPLAGFARMFPGEWQMTVASGTSMFRTWHRGPSRHSLRVVTDGVGAGGEPWRELEVLYWHPGRQRICSLHWSCYARGVAAAEVRWIGETVQFDSDLHQLRGRRTLRSLWTFTGPDTYHAALLEALPSPAATFTPLAEWDLHRRQPPDPARSLAVDGVDEPSGLLGPLRHLLGPWQERTDPANVAASPLRVACEWMPLADVIQARVAASSQAGDVPLLDLFLYHHTGTGRLRCFAVDNRGHVHEGDLHVADGGGVQIDLQSHGPDGVLGHVVRLDFDAAGAMHQRVWRVDGDRRRLVQDRHFTRSGPRR